MEHIVLHFLGSFENILRSSTMGNSVKVCCVPRTMPCLTSLSLAIAAINDCGFALIQNPHYSTNLTPSDFPLFPNLKKVISAIFWYPFSVT